MPTHFYVAFNDSPLKKEAMEKLTFALCHYYFNWAGPIKVPAPCMYAHKIAELFMHLGHNKLKSEKGGCKDYVMSKYVAENLHFL